MVESSYPSCTFQNKKPNIAASILLILLTVFFTFHSSRLRLPTTTEPASIGAPAPLKTPAIKASQSIKFVSRAQIAFKLANNGDGNDLDTPQSKYIVAFNAQLKLFKSKPLSQAFADFHYQRFYEGNIQPRAPPTVLT